jgi:hypothetical protein
MITVAGLFFIQNSITNLEHINGIFLRLFNDSSIAAILIAIAVGCFSLGIFTSLAFVPLGIFIPIIIALPLSHMEILLYVDCTGDCFITYHLLKVMITKVRNREHWIYVVRGLYCDSNHMSFAIHQNILRHTGHCVLSWQCPEICRKKKKSVCCTAVTC